MTLACISERQKRIGQGSTSAVKPLSNLAAIRYALGGALPGAWISDHRKEVERYTDWNYIAIRALERQAQQAQVFVFDDSGDDGFEREAVRQDSRNQWREDPVGRLMGKGYWSAVSGRSELTKSLYQQPEAKSEPLDSTHPLVRLLAQPNEWQNGSSFRAERMQQLSITGMCLVWNRKNRAGKTIERYIIPTAIAQAVPRSRDLPMGGWRLDMGLTSRFLHDLDGFVETRGIGLMIGHIIPAEHVQVTRLSHPIHPDAGYSPTSAGSKLLDILHQVIVANWSQLQNGADPSLFIQLPDGFGGDEAELEAISARIQSKYSGALNHSKVMIGSGKPTVLSHSAKEMDYGKAYEMYRDSVLALHGVSPIAAGVQQPTGTRGYYAPLKQFTDLTVQPSLDMLAEDDTMQLGPEFGERLTIEYEAKRVDDPEMVERQMQTNITSTAMKVDEYRAARGWKLLGGEEGERLIGKADPAAMGLGGPFGQQPGGQFPQFGEDPDEPEDEENGDGEQPRKPNGQANGNGNPSWMSRSDFAGLTKAELLSVSRI